jgi:hypothetical protein
MATQGLFQGGNGSPVRCRYLPALFHQAGLIADSVTALNQKRRLPAILAEQLFGKSAGAWEALKRRKALLGGIRLSG